MSKKFHKIQVHVQFQPFAQGPDLGSSLRNQKLNKNSTFENSKNKCFGNLYRLRHIFISGSCVDFSKTVPSCVSLAVQPRFWSFPKVRVLASHFREFPEVVAGDNGKILDFFGKYFDRKSAFFLPFLRWIQWDFFGNETKTIFRKKPKFYRYRRLPVTRQAPKLPKSSKTPSLALCHTSGASNSIGSQMHAELRSRQPHASTVAAAARVACYLSASRRMNVVKLQSFYRACMHQAHSHHQIHPCSRRQGIAKDLAGMPTPPPFIPCSPSSDPTPAPLPPTPYALACSR